MIASKIDHGATVDELVRESFGHSMGTNGERGGYVTQELSTPEEEGSCTDEEAADGIRTHDLLHGKQRRRLRRLTTEDDESRLLTRVSAPSNGSDRIAMLSRDRDVWVTTGSRPLTKKEE